MSDNTTDLKQAIKQLPKTIYPTNPSKHLYPTQWQVDIDELVDLIQAREKAARLDELQEARKWSTKAETADQVWQQLADRINGLKK